MTSAASTTRPSATRLVGAAYANQRAWVQRAGTRDEHGRPRSCFQNGDVIAVRTGASGAMMLPLCPDPALAILPGALGWLRHAGAGDTLIWTASPDELADRWLTAHGAHDSFNPRWMVRDLARPSPRRVTGGIATIRPARPGDLPALLHRAEMPYFSSWEAHATVALSVKEDAPVRLLLALVDDGIVGRAVLNLTASPLGRIAGIFDVGVMPQWQRHGIGRQLVQALLATARAADARFATLNATPAAERLYHHAGFVDIGEGQTWLLPAQTLRQPPRADHIRFAMAISGDDDLPSMQALARSELPNGDTPLAHAARFGQIGSARRLAGMGTIPDVAALWLLGLTGEAQEMMHAPGALNTLLGPQRVAPLHVAIHRDDPEFVAALLEAGANPAVRDGTFGSDARGWCHALGNDELLALIDARRPES